MSPRLRVATKAPSRPALPSFLLTVGPRFLALLFASGVALAGCGGESGSGPSPDFRVEDPGPVHVHGLGVNPADGALFIATHTGLFRSSVGETSSKRVGDRLQDTMGFTITGPDRFLGSGHPDGRDGLPPFLGLIRSGDAGRSWRPVSLQGKRDFHALQAAGTRVYGYGSDFKTRKAGLLVSADGGKTWSSRRAPEPLLSLSATPQEPDRLLAGGSRAVWRSDNGARTWTRLRGPGGLVSSEQGNDYRVTADGSVAVSNDDGIRWRPQGRVGGQPAAFQFSSDALYVALHDGTVKRSTDRGRTWRVRSRPSGPLR